MGESENEAGCRKEQVASNSDVGGPWGMGKMKRQGMTEETCAETKWYSVANQRFFYGTIAH